MLGPPLHGVSQMRIMGSRVERAKVPCLTRGALVDKFWAVLIHFCRQ